MKENITTSLKRGYKDELIKIALSEGIGKEYNKSIEFLVDEWRKRNGQDKLAPQSGQ